MRWKLHVRFGERAGETDQPKRWHRAPVRLNQRATREYARGTLKPSSRRRATPRAGRRPLVLDDHHANQVRHRTDGDLTLTGGERGSKTARRTCRAAAARRLWRRRPRDHLPAGTSNGGRRTAASYSGS
jgi:hypothetical protein